MPEKTSMFSLKIDPELRAAFTAAAAAADRPASQIVRELMRAYVQDTEQAGYRDFLAEKVAAARLDMAAGNGRDNAEVSAEFARRRAKLRARLNKAES
jgi:predicted DNA-binding protein